jgi:hypothetical protein
MQKYASILLTLICFLGLGVAAEGQSQQEVVVTVPYEFVAGTTTLPAGTYTVGRVYQNRLGGLMISSYDTQSSVFVMPDEFESHSTDNVSVGFTEIGDVHFLSKIETADGTYNLPLSRRATLVGAQKQHSMSASGTN